MHYVVTGDPVTVDGYLGIVIMGNASEEGPEARRGPSS